MKNRDTTVIYWELLKAMASEPQRPSRLARVANIPYDRLDDYLGPLVSGGLVKVDSIDGHNLYSVTPKGMEVLNYLDSGLKLLYPAFK